MSSCVSPSNGSTRACSRKAPLARIRFRRFSRELAASDNGDFSDPLLDGRVHAPIVFSDDEKNWGGHPEPGTTVLTFALITWGVLPEGIDLTRLDEPGW